MNLLFFNRSYWPDVEATGQLLTELCTDLARTHNVIVVAGQPNYVTPTGIAKRETHQGVTILRVRNPRFTKVSFLGRVISLSLYVLFATWIGLRQRRPDVIVVETDPPVLGMVGIALKVWHHCKMVYYVQDIYPEVGLATGKLRPGFLTWVLKITTQRSLQSADRVVVLGQDMKDRIIERAIDPSKVDIVPNWADPNVVKPVVGPNPFRDMLTASDRFVVMYSGNHGATQGLDSVLRVARELAATRAYFVFIGEGGMKSSLKKQASLWNLNNVHFLPYQPKETLAYSLGAADLHLISQLPGLSGYIVPSKLYGILAAGVPYVAMTESTSEVARVTNENNTGLVITPNSQQELVDAIKWCMSNPVELRAMGCRGRQLAESKYNRVRSVSAFDTVLNGLRKA